MRLFAAALAVLAACDAAAEPEPTPPFRAAPVPRPVLVIPAAQPAGLARGADGALTVGGSRGGPVAAEGFVTRFRADGSELWSQSLGAQVRAVAIDGEDGVVAIGRSFEAPEPGGGLAFVARYRADGALTWFRPIAAAPAALAIDDGGDVLVTGSFIGEVDFGGSKLVAGDGTAIFVARYTPAGALRWARGYFDLAPGRGWGVGLDVEAAGGGDVVITGRFGGRRDFGGGVLASSQRDGHFLDAAFVVRLGPGGEHRWSRTWGEDARGRVLAVGAGGRVAMAGTFIGTLAAQGAQLAAGRPDAEQVFVTLLEPDGETVWTRAFTGEGEWSTVEALVAGADGALTLAGSFETGIEIGGDALAGTPGLSAFATQLDAAGELRWAVALIGSEFATGEALVGGDGGAVLLGGAFADDLDLGGAVLAGEGGYVAALTF